MMDKNSAKIQRRNLFNLNHAFDHFNQILELRMKQK